MMALTMLVWGKTTVTTRKTSTSYPDTAEELILTVEPIEGKNFNRKFSFNTYAQEKLELHQQVAPEVVKNNNAIFSFNPETKQVFLGIYNAEAFAEIEKFTTIPKMEIGKTTMGFSSKPLHEALKAQFKFDETKVMYFKLVPVEIEGSPVQLYAFEPTSENAAEAAEEAVTAVTTEELMTFDDEVPALVPAGEAQDVTVD